MVEQPVLLLPILLTGFAPLAIYLFRKNINRREGASLVAGLAAFICMLTFVPAVLAGKILFYHVSTILPGIEIKFCLDGLGIIFGLVATFLWVLATSYNIGYMRALEEHAQTRYYLCFSIAIFGAVGVAMSANVFTLYLFYEVISIFTYPLVAHHQDEEAYHGARKYLVYLVGTSKLFLLPAMIMTYVLCGTLDFNLTDIARGIFPASADPVLVQITYALYVMGLAKAAIMPFHNWLPSAMVAPTPVSALLHAVAVVKAGVFSVSRILLSVFGVDLMTQLGLGLATACLAALTIVLASVIALTKDDLKARLAYSTVSQLSYVVLGVSLLTPLSIKGGIGHIAFHAFSKITLFFGAGAIYVATHQKKISAMAGLGRRLPWTFGAFFVASLSMVGIPPICGFVSKWYMINGAASMGYYLFVGALLASTILNAAYFMPITYKAFFAEPIPGVDLEHYSEAPLAMVVPLCLTAVITVFLGIYPDVFMNFVNIFMSAK